MSNKGDSKKIAIVHDELTRRGGAEAVCEEMLRIFPEADLYALYTGRPEIEVDGKVHQIHTSFLQKLPAWFRRHPSRVLAWLPQAAEQFDLSGYDVVISSASAFAKGVITRVNVAHICYCHTPTRYVWDATHDVVRESRWGTVWLARIVLHYLRLADFTAAQRVNVFVANSEYTRQRIRQYYRRDSRVIWPPIDTAFFHPDPQALENKELAPFLIVGRLNKSKYFEQAVTVCNKLNLPLTVVGEGPMKRRLIRLSGTATKFRGVVNRQELRLIYRQARAVLQPGAEDFGISSAEALACGTPVIAYSRGGASEIIEDGATGVLYGECHEEGLAEAMRVFIARDRPFRVKDMRESVEKYNRRNFREAMQKLVNDIVI